MNNNRKINSEFGVLTTVNLPLPRPGLIYSSTLKEHQSFPFKANLNKWQTKQTPNRREWLQSRKYSIRVNAALYSAGTQASARPAVGGGEFACSLPRVTPDLIEMEILGLKAP